MVGSIQPVGMSAMDIQQLLAQAIAQILDQATNVALLNLQMIAGNPEGVGENIDIVA